MQIPTLLQIMRPAQMRAKLEELSQGFPHNTLKGEITGSRSTMFFTKANVHVFGFFFGEKQRI